MVRVDGVENNNEKGYEIPGRRSIGRAIEESLAMKIKRIPVGNSERDKRIESKENSIAMEVDIPEGNRVRVGVGVGEGADSVSGNRFQNLQPSTELGTPKVAEKPNLEKLDAESEAYILDKLSLLQPSFRTLFEPSVKAANSTVSNSDNKTRKRQEEEVGKTKWKKKIKDLFLEVTNSGSKKQPQQQIPDHHHLESVLYEADVKGILKMKWIEERKKSEVMMMKKKRRWLTSCICFPHSNICGRKQRKEWETQLEEYSSATW